MGEALGGHGKRRRNIAPNTGPAGHGLGDISSPESAASQRIEAEPKASATGGLAAGFAQRCIQL